MTYRARQVVRATRWTHENAIAADANEDTAYEAACALYRFGHPRTPEQVIGHIVAVLIGRSAQRNAWRTDASTTGNPPVRPEAFQSAILLPHVELTSKP
jgi:hypothetical protein